MGPLLWGRMVKRFLDSPYFRGNRWAVVGFAVALCSVYGIILGIFLEIAGRGLSFDGDFLEFFVDVFSPFVTILFVIPLFLLVMQINLWSKREKLQPAWMFEWMERSAPRARLHRGKGWVKAIIWLQFSSCLLVSLYMLAVEYPGWDNKVVLVSAFFWIDSVIFLELYLAHTLLYKYDIFFEYSFIDRETTNILRGSPHPLGHLYNVKILVYYLFITSFQFFVLWMAIHTAWRWFLPDHYLGIINGLNIYVLITGVFPLVYGILILNKTQKYLERHIVEMVDRGDYTDSPLNQPISSAFALVPVSTEIISIITLIVSVVYLFATI